jgi:cytochrome c553
MRSAVLAAATCWLVGLPSAGLADRVAGKEKADMCLLCHGAYAFDGKGYVPIVDAQPPAYLIAQLTAYKTGKRIDAVGRLAMNTNAADLSAVDVQDLADFFASRKAQPYPVFDVERAGSGIKKLTGLPCHSCHGPDYIGNGAAARLAGQNPRYTASELRYMRSGKRLHPTSDGGDAVKSLTDDDINDVAHALASLN